MTDVTGKESQSITGGQRRHRGRASFVVATDQRDLGAVLKEATGNGEADSGSTSCDDGDASG
jgi:hypothetical protein